MWDARADSACYRLGRYYLAALLALRVQACAHEVETNNRPDLPHWILLEFLAALTAHLVVAVDRLDEPITDSHLEDAEAPAAALADRPRDRMDNSPSNGRYAIHNCSHDALLTPRVSIT